MDVRSISDPALCTCLAVRQAARHISQFYDMCLAPTGLKTSQYSILAKLERLGPSTMCALATELVIDRTTLKRNLVPLERENLVQVAVDTNNRRNRIAQLTPVGTATLSRARVLWTEAQETFETKFGRDRTLDLRSLLKAAASIDLGASPVDAP